MSDNEINELVRSTLERKIIEAFRDTPQMIDELVQACLKREVNDHGGEPNYHTKGRMPYLTYLARSAVQDIAKATVTEHVKSLEPQIRERVVAGLNAESITDAITKSILYATKNDWQIRVEFEQVEDK